ncbi:alginate lyase family protein [Simiduia agarivorans]|uniref:Alginate lyase domain-containing protein n=1 Tax=Simiduia agarivorans (strain DSM 21679 / JCM 13881 / BCRC 17597 / SA1) TaxID=1117647 RepID=K4KL75_SIMAS|nr:alginate lyase family protein [Simiduia agarivorans]AFU98803.1 hypothetical protein M5M_08070 [Simiduia agarivorans SA1 = DSM 21679]
MRRQLCLGGLALLLLGWAVTDQTVAIDTSVAAVSETRVLRLDHQQLIAIRAAWQEGQAPYANAVDTLLTEAKGLLNLPAPTVKNSDPGITKAHPNDYVSLAPYWWPDPAKLDGLPWIKRDGQRNPWVDSEQGAKAQWNRFARGVEILALAHFYSGDEAYRRAAIHWFDVFLVQSDTRMNPHLNYAQSVPGVAAGRPYGIIDTVYLPQVIDAYRLLAPAMAPAQRHAVQAWFGEFYQWLTESPLGVEEQQAHNNHGTFYDLQVLALALQLARNEEALKILARAGQRLATQVEANGAQPHELARTKPFHYSAYNLRAFDGIASLARHLDQHWWQDKARLIAALHYLQAGSDKAHWGGSEEPSLERTLLTSPWLSAAVAGADLSPIAVMTEACFARQYLADLASSIATAVGRCDY